MKWRDNCCMAFNFTSVLPCYVDMLSHISVKPNLMSPHCNSCLSFSPCQCNSDTDLSLCIFILVTVHISAAMKISFPLVTVLLHLVFSSIPQWYSPFANMTLTLYFSGKYFHSLVPLCNNKEVVHAKARGLLPRSLFF